MTAERDIMESSGIQYGYERVACDMCGKVMREMSVEFVETDMGEEVIVACDAYIDMVRNPEVYEPNKEYLLPCQAIVSTAIPLDPEADG